MGEYRRWEERVGKGVGDGNVVGYGRGTEERVR